MQSEHSNLLKVREALLKTGTSQRVFARRHQVSPGYVARVLKGDFCPSARLAAIFVDYMDRAGLVSGELEKLKAERSLRTHTLPVEAAS